MERGERQQRRRFPAKETKTERARATVTEIRILLLLFTPRLPSFFSLSIRLFRSLASAIILDVSPRGDKSRGEESERERFEN